MCFIVPFLSNYNRSLLCDTWDLEKPAHAKTAIKSILFVSKFYHNFQRSQYFSTFQEYKNTLNDEVKTIAPRGGSSVVASKNGDKIFLLGKAIDIGGNSLKRYSQKDL